MAMFRFGHAEVVEPSIAPDTWTKSVCCGHTGPCKCETSSYRTKVAKTVLAKYTPEKYLLSHCSIMAAVDVEDATKSRGPQKDFLIHPAFSKFVNNNGDAWTKKMLVASYKTFVGSNNYLEHVQVPELSKGKVIDAVLRDVPVGKDASGKDLTTYYVDILVATDRKHDDLCRRIEAGIMNSMSMGCKISYSICSKCGNKAADETEACAHVRFEKGNSFIDERGVSRKVAELCGHHTEPESVVFVDASWVVNPAFTGAVRRNTIMPSDDVLAKIKSAQEKPAVITANAYAKAAAEDAEPGAVQEDKPAEEEVPVDAPAEDAPAEDTPTDAPAEDIPMDEPEEEDPAAMMKDFKKNIKKQLLQQLSDEIMSEFSGDNVEEGPRPLDTLDETMITQAALKKAFSMKQTWDKWLARYSGDQKAIQRLKFGSFMLLNSSDLSVLKDYGYTRRDFLAVMSFLDDAMPNPLPKDLKKAMGSMRLASTPLDTLRWLVTYTGRKITAFEARKAIAWLKVMEKYPVKVNL